MGDKDDYGNLLSDSLANTNTNANSLFGDGYTVALPGAGSTALTQSQDNSGNTGSLGNANTGNGAFLGEGVRSGIDSWDKAYTDAGGKIPSRFGLSDLKQFALDNKSWLAGAGALASVYGGGSNVDKKTGYQGVIPTLAASRSMIAAPPTRAQGYRPGAGGIDYGGDVSYKLAPGMDPYANLSGTSGSLAGANLTPGSSIVTAGGTTVTPGGTKVVTPGDTKTTVVGGTGTDTTKTTGTDTTKTNVASKGYQDALKAGLTPAQYYGNINQWLIDNPRASRSQIDAIMAQVGVSKEDLQKALGTSGFSDFTKYGLTQGQGLQELNIAIANWVEKNPFATSQEIKDIMKAAGASQEDVARGINALSASAGKEAAIVGGMGLDQLYKNILDYQSKSRTPEEIAAALAATGLEQRDLNAAQRYAKEKGYVGNPNSEAATYNYLNNQVADTPITQVAEILKPEPPPPVAQVTNSDKISEIYQYFADPSTQAALASGDTRSIAETMQALGYSPAEVAQATGSNLAEVQAAYDAALGIGQPETYYGYAQGGMAKGRYLQGETDGMADELPAQIGQDQPAALSHGEFVIPADVVSHMGNGNSDAGAKKLYQMMDKIRMARTGNKKQGKKINPDKFMPGGLAQASKGFSEGGETTEQWAARQPNLTNVADPMERKNALESWQKQRPGYVDPMDYQTYNEYALAANPRNKEFNTNTGAELQNQANFYGMTTENYQNALAGDPTKPMGQYQSVYGKQLLSPIEQIAAQTARGQGIGEPNAYAMELAKKYPEVFNAAAKRYQNYFAKTFPGTLEYEGVLKGPSVYDRTGMKKAANGGLMKLASGGKVQKFNTGGTAADKNYAAGISGIESNLSNWAGPYVTNMLGQGQALANMPYQAYMGQLTAGESPLQTSAFQNASGLQTPASIGTAATTAGNIATAAQGLKYTPTTSSFDTAQMQNYMNPYLKGALEPQLDEARRQSQLTQQMNAGKMTQAGAFGGGRQAILDAETQRNLASTQANITGQGYSTAYDKAMAQFNADQQRKMAENQYGAGYGLQGLQTGLQAAQAQGGLGATQASTGLANLSQQLAAGQQQRGIESEGIAADKAQFEEARANPYKMVQYQQSLLQGLPLAAQSYQGIDPSTLTKAAQGATSVNQLLKNLGLIS